MSQNDTQRCNARGIAHATGCQRCERAKGLAGPLPMWASVVLLVAVVGNLSGAVSPWWRWSSAAPHLEAVLIVGVTIGSCLWFVRNLVGHGLWQYASADGFFHQHSFQHLFDQDDQPSDIPPRDTRYPVLRVRVGGLLRSCRMYAGPQGDWKVTAWDGRKVVTVSDKAGGSFSGESPLALALTREFSTILSMWHDWQQEQRIITRVIQVIDNAYQEASSHRSLPTMRLRRALMSVMGQCLTREQIDILMHKARVSREFFMNWHHEAAQCGNGGWR